MKRNLLIGLAIATLSLNSFAAEITHGKLISHKEWFKANVKGAFESSNNQFQKLHSYRQNNNSSDPLDYINLNASLYKDSQDADHFKGHVVANVINTSNTSQIYEMSTKVSICHEMVDGWCNSLELVMTAEDMIMLDSQGIYAKVQTPRITYKLGEKELMVIDTSVKVQDHDFSSSAVYGAKLK